MSEKVFEVGKSSAFATQILSFVNSTLRISPDFVDKIEGYYSCDDSLKARQDCENAIESGNHRQINSFPKSNNAQHAILCTVLHLGSRQLWCLSIDSSELYEDMFMYSIWDDEAKEWIYKREH
ncbi:MAG: hypothetical protein ABIS12_09550 [Bacteroidia bacterium]